MAENPNTNPFLEDDLIENDLIEDEIETVAAPESSVAESPSEITIDSVAARLLKDNLILTALELHTELIEGGRDLPRLRDYFSNPGNFERTKSENTSPTLPRTSSVQTFDSLDFARYSDDGERQVDERFAVLEFELRKAQETIKSLRASLTKQAEAELPSPEGDEEDAKTSGVEEPIRPLERRALNFLVNEYLLRNNYKLTSVTYAEENEEQDFEDWDDVGLNIPKPPDILRLYRDYTNHLIPTRDVSDAECEADIEDIHFTQLQAEWENVRDELASKVNDLEEQISSLRLQNTSLQAQLQSQEILLELRESSTPINTPVKNGFNKRAAEDIVDNPSHIETTPPHSLEDGVSLQLSDENRRDNNLSVSASRDLGTVGDIAPSPSVTSPPGENLASESMQVEVGSQLHENVTNCTTNFDDFNSSHEESISDRLCVPDFTNRKMSPAFRKALLSISFYMQKDNRIVTELSKLGDSDKEKVVFTLARCLPHIVPNVLLAKREELIPLILCTATLHPDPNERDKLLNILFNLIKKPDEEQRQMILTGCVAFAESAGQTRVEAELLPQCWEQINHKYIERRLLVAEACGALAPHVPNEIRSSLVLSMLRQMLAEDKAEEVREAVVKSLGLVIGFIGDKDKYSQGLEMLMSSLNDPSDRVVAAAQLVFLPSFALWAYELGKLEHDLANVLLRKMEELGALAMQKTTNSTTLPLDENKFVLMIRTLQELVPFLYLSMLEAGPFADRVETVIEEAELIDASRFPRPASSLTDLRVIVGDHQQLSALVHLFDLHMDQEWVEPWEIYSWVTNNLIPRLIEVVGGIGLSLPKIVPAFSSLFYTICRMFGPMFADKKIKLRFKDILTVPEEQLYTDVVAGQTALTACCLPVYTAGVLTAFNTEADQKELTQFLQETLTTLALCQAPLESLKATFYGLGSANTHHDMLLGVLWDGVVHTSAQVRCVAARMFELLIKGLNESELSTRVIPALVTLANDPEISVRVSTIPALGTIIENVAIREMLDRVYMQLQTFLDDPQYRDQHTVHVELIRMFSRIAPNSEPKFREEFVLPRLAAMAQANNNASNDTKKRDIAMQLFEAYSALSCCFLSDQLVQEAMLPGLRCLKQDMVDIAADHEEVVQSMIREYETRLDTPRPQDRSSSLAGSLPPSLSSVSPSTEDMRARVMNRIKDTTARANIANIFGRKK